MGIADKAGNKAEELAGRAKQAIGDATDDHDLQAEGRSQKTAAKAKQAGEHVKDAGRDIKEGLS